MSIENFFTTHNAVTPQGAKGLSTVKGQALSADSAQGLAFLDFILARLNEATKDEAAPKGGTHDPLQSDNPALEKNPKLELAKILADNPEAKEELNNFIEATGLGPDAALTHVLELNKQAFDEVLAPLSDGIITAEEIANGSPRILQALLIEPENGDEVFISKINEIKAKIQKLIASGKGEIIATNFTPEELATIQNLPDGAFDFEAALKEAGIPQELIDKTSVVLIKFVAPQDSAVEQSADLSDDPAMQNILALFIPPVQKNAQGGMQTAADAAASSTHQSPENILAARLNALSPGGNSEGAFTIDEYTGNAQTKGNSANTQAADAIGGKPQSGQQPPAPSADLSLLQNFPYAAGTLNAPFADILAQFEQSGLPGTAQAPLTISTLASAITQAQSAASAHPAAQMVAINIQKAAADNQNRTLTMQLDPPELGRVHVKMEFGHDKTVKAVVMAEKPETFMMLQRDAQTLERALQEAGLDTDGGLSFELAEQGFDFDGDNRRGGGHDQGGTGAGNGADEPELIQSTMTWHVDAETGHTRYDILA